jgi:hypothetical protein
MKSKVFYAFIFVLLLACNKENEDITTPLSLNQWEDHLIFATSANCTTDCTELFAIQAGKLYSEKSNFPIAPNSQRDFVELSATQYELVKDLAESIPDEFLSSTEISFGTGTAADRGVIYLEIKTGGVIRYCVIDNTKQDVPEYLHPVVDKIEEKISLLK